MKIIIAGAGSGKTTSMANKIVESANNRLLGKNYFCIAFTNNAVEHISNKLSELYDGEIPNYIKVMTIHSFLYQEIIKPYYYLLYGINYESVSLNILEKNVKYRMKEISDLEKNGVIHVSAITQRAMWVLKGKSSDRKIHKSIRNQILNIFSNYCEHIFVDEAQDIDDFTRQILEVLDDVGINITLVGDPKQDLHGFDNLRELSNKENAIVEYISQCYRCPKKHLKISNTLVDDKEKQSSNINEGSVVIKFETNISNISEYIKRFDLAYIIKKNNHFDTHADNQNELFDSLYHLMLKLYVKYRNDPDLVLHRRSFLDAKYLLNKTNKYNISEFIEITFGSKIERKEFAQITSLINNAQYHTNNVLVSSIESIKGQEGDDCLFILTKDLAPYLFLDREENNKTKAALYVALTRSRKRLTILLTSEAEKIYGKSFVKEYFSKLYGII